MPRDPLGHVRRRVLLEETSRLDPIRPAHHRERPVLEMRDENGRDRAVVLEQIALRDLVLGEEDLVEVRELQLATAFGHPVEERLLAPNLARLFVLSQSLIGRRAQSTVVCPLGELDLADEDRFDPDHVAFSHLRHLRNFAKRRSRTLERAKLVEQLVDLLAREAGAHVARVDELVAAVEAEHQRAEARRAATGSLREARDHELLAPVGLDLQPVAIALADGVARVEALGDDPFELLLLRSGEKRLAVVERLLDTNRAIALVEELNETLAPLDEREVDERLSLHLEDV